jgi:hypothetical protein
MTTELQRRALAMPAARAYQVEPGSWNHFERLPPRPGDRYTTTIGLTVNR